MIGNSFVTRIPLEEDSGERRIEASETGIAIAHGRSQTPAKCIHQTVTFVTDDDIVVRSICWIEEE